LALNPYQAAELLESWQAQSLHGFCTRRILAEPPNWGAAQFVVPPSGGLVFLHRIGSLKAELKAVVPKRRAHQDMQYNNPLAIGKPVVYLFARNSS